MLKISEMPELYGHLPKVTGDQFTCDKIKVALEGGDMGPVYEAKEDPNHPGIITVGGKVYIESTGEGGHIQCN